MKKKVLAITLMVFVLLTMVGCGQQTATTAGSGGAAPVVLGVATALGTIEGSDSLKAVQLAVDEINAQGGVDVGGTKRPFKVESIDTREAEPNVPINDALSALQKLIDEKKPAAMVVGSFRSEVLMADMDLIAKAKVPYITSIAMTPDFEKNIAANKDKYKYLFRDTLSSANLVSNLQETLKFIGQKYNMSKVYFINQDVAWAKGTADGLDAWAKQSGWTVVGHDAYPGGASDFSSSITKAKNGSAQVVVPVFDMPESANLVKQAKSMKLTALMAGFISPATADTAPKTFGTDIDGMVNFLFEPGSLPSKSLPKATAFNEAFGKKFGEDARAKMSGHGPGPAYDSVYALADAIKKAGSLDADAIVSALEKTDMDGVVGHLKFNANHQAVYGTDPKTTAISMAFQWVNGKRVPVFPAGIGEAEIQLPAK